MMTRSLPTLFDNADFQPMRFSSVVDRLFNEMVGANRAGFVPKMDVAETDKAFEITFELPGMEKKDINIEFENNMLTISGERRWDKE